MFKLLKLKTKWLIGSLTQHSRGEALGCVLAAKRGYRSHRPWILEEKKGWMLFSGNASTASKEGQRAGCVSHELVPAQTTVSPLSAVRRALLLPTDLSLVLGPLATSPSFPLLPHLSAQAIEHCMFRRFETWCLIFFPRLDEQNFHRYPI